MTQFVIDLLDSSGNALGSGPLQNVISVSVTEKLDEAGEVSFVVPATDARVATLIDSAARFCVRFSSGAVRYGIIDQDAIDVTADTPTRTVTGADMLRELAHYSMGWWCFYDNKDLNTVVLPQLVADTPWSLGTVDASLGTLYYRFDGDSRLAALLKIAETTGYHFRLGTTDRTFDFGAFGTASAFRFTNVDHALVSQDNSTAFRIIGNLQITSDRAPVVNRIIPWGAGNDGGDTNRAKVSLFHLTPGDSRWANIKAKPGVRGVSHTINSISEIGGHHYEMDSTAGYYELPVNQVLWCYDPNDLTLGYGYDFVIRDVDPLGANTLTVRGSPTVPTEPTSFPAYLISNPQLYIQDDTAYAADPHEATIIFQDIALTDLGLDAFESSASQLYDRAYRYLQDHKVPQVSYAVSVFDCPDSLRVGDTVQIVYRGAVTRDGATVKWVDLNESFNVVNITRTFNADGSTAATVEISNIARQATDSASAMSDSGTQTGAMAVTVGSPSVSSASGGGGGSGGAGDPLTFASPLVRTINNITLPLTTGYIFKGVSSTATATAPEALTKTDDTNVTLTLGGGHATALVNASSLTLGWQGVLSPTRGGTGVNNGAYTLALSGNSTINGTFTGGGSLTVTNTGGLTFSGSYTLTVRATGTAALINYANTGYFAISSDSDSTGYLKVGLNPASVGSIRLPYASTMNFRNEANDGDVAVFWVNSGDQLRIGNITNPLGTSIYSGNGTTLYFGGNASNRAISISANSAAAVSVNADNISSTANYFSVEVDSAVTANAVFGVYGNGRNHTFIGALDTTTGQTCTIQPFADRVALRVTGFATQTASRTLINLIRNDANTNAVAPVITAAVNTTGTAADGLGGSIVLNLESSTTADQAAGLIEWYWPTGGATHASRFSTLALSAYSTTNKRTGLTIQADSVASQTTIIASQAGAYATTAINLTLTTAHHWVKATAACTITLPTAVGITGREYIITATANSVVIDGNASETISGALTATLNTGDTLQIKSDNANWFIC